MLSIIIQVASGNEVEERWHVGEKNPVRGLSSELANRIVEIQADCDELMYIARNFDNVPIHKTRLVQRWVGDMAKFIALNLDK